MRAVVKTFFVRRVNPYKLASVRAKIIDIV